MKEEVIVVSDDELPVRRKGPRITQVRGMVLNEKAKAKWDLTKFTGHMDYKTGRILYIVTESCRQDALTYVFANRNRIEDATEHLFYTANVMEAIVKEVHKGFKACRDNELNVSQLESTCLVLVLLREMASSNNVRDDFLLNNVPSCVDGIVSMKPKNCNQYAMRDYAMKVLKTVFSLPSPTLCTFIINTDYTSKLGNLLESSDLNDIQIGAQGLKSHLSLPMGVNYVCSVPGRINFMLTQLNKATKTMLERTSDHIIGIIVACYQKIAADRRSNGYSPEKVHPSILDDTFLEPLKRARARRFRQPRIINQIVHQ